MQTLISELASAWNRWDAAAFAKRFRSDGTFTNVNGATFEGHSAFEQRHREIFAGSLKGSAATLTIRRCQFVRPDVAIVDVDCLVTVPAAPSIESRLLLVLTKESGDWSIAAFHNTAVQSRPIVR
jgi:uncharacterized protein (TIGR02246 family)